MNGDEMLRKARVYAAKYRDANYAVIEMLADFGKQVREDLYSSLEAEIRAAAIHIHLPHTKCWACEFADSLAVRANRK